LECLERREVPTALTFADFLGTHPAFHGPLAPTDVAETQTQPLAASQASDLSGLIQPTIDIDAVLRAAQAKLAAFDAKNSIKTRYPTYASASGSVWNTAGASDWHSGFYPGMLWQMYQATGDPVWRTRAEAWTKGIEGQKTNTKTHDVGFIVYDSVGQAERATGNSHYRNVLLATAKSLSSRYNTKVGMIRSWNGGNYRVIVDNMMNLELLFWAAKHGGTTARGGSAQDLYNMAVSHANKTLQHFIRPDGSSVHVVNFDANSGRVLSKSSGGAGRVDSAWSRGQAWAVYGFTMAYRETGDTKFLEAARRTADYFIKNLPKDYVPQADFKSAFTDLAHKDSSAAAIASSALFELSTLETDAARSSKYFTSGTQILKSLTSPSYFSSDSKRPALLLHGAHSYPGDNVSLIYGDYYLLEATLRYAKLIHT
jgi:unsaturated chondroitin disaccharide hydrolase